MLNHFLSKRLKPFAKPETDIVEYLDRVYLFLDKLEPGSMATVSKLADAESADLFIECVKLFIEEIGQNISFTDNTFSRFIKGEEIDYNLFKTKKYD
ncbi:MAG: hypothetical protein N4A72_00775 [Bacteroidales bacterium]|jgi:hypothetical protein|nr:hypothetical protein [Bacteroidales bacterium]